jgi:hypothetical protein
MNLCIQNIKFRCEDHLSKSEFITITVKVSLLLLKNLVICTKKKIQTNEERCNQAKFAGANHAL